MWVEVNWGSGVRVKRGGSLVLRDLPPGDKVALLVFGARNSCLHHLELDRKAVEPLVKAMDNWLNQEA